jgi:ArsR family transcriptional regulator
MEVKNMEIFDKNKLLILYHLYHCKDSQCGCDIKDQIEISKSLLSYHIKTLIEKDFVVEKRCGNRKNYWLNDDKIGLIRHILMAVELL